MTPNDFKILEQKRIELEKGYYLTPYRVAMLTKLSSKIIAMLSTATAPQLSYAECRYVLELTRNALDMACEGEKENPAPCGTTEREQR